MPNRLNFTIDYEWLTMWVIPILYIIYFPPLYMHMVKLRAKWYH